ncbi:LAQU0S03e00188g1_1 [Lachancea quebecensis]|uniref:Maintenance of telomere capping protein 6 n=1 Tax=Lachancea quebecensis TaxID=1654605 RepID=A0A0P1KNG4_9SACH|nr:LAQU0S03e00188g1_1 [Lachancea quebecensis]
MNRVVYGLLLTLVLSAVRGQNFWPVLSSNSLIALRSQRDVLSNISIDKVPVVGVQLNDVAFRGTSNETESLGVLASLLNVGVQAYMMDIEFDKSYNLTISGSNTSFGTTLSTIKRFISSTNNYLNADILVLLLRLKQSQNASTEGTPASYPNITAILDLYLGSSAIYTPSQLMYDRSSGNVAPSYGNLNSPDWPSLNYFLYSIQKRVTVFYVDTASSDALQSPVIFNSSSLNYKTSNTSITCPLTNNAQVLDMSNLGWRFLQKDFSSDDIGEYTRCGYSPIIDKNYSPDSIKTISNVLENSLLWSWAPNEPDTSDNARSNSTSLVARRCAVVNYTKSNSSSYWTVANCYDRKRALCKRDGNDFEWAVTQDSASYFSHHDQDGNGFCPENFSLSLPQTALQEKSLDNYLSQLSPDTWEIWIDLNSVSVPDCWVPDGPYASCPYQKEVSARNFVSMITPVSVFAFVTIVMLIMLSWRRVPIQDNRKRWKRVINSRLGSKAEGVPA